MKQHNWIRFQPEFGWSELISLLALGAAAFAIWQTHRLKQPDVTARVLQTKSDELHLDSAGEYKLIGVVPVLLINSGGRGVSLIKIRGAYGPFALAGFRNGALVATTDNMVYRFYAIDSLPSDLIGLVGAGKSGHVIDLRTDDGTVVEMPITTDAPRIMYFVLEVDAYEGVSRKVDEFFLSIDLTFSHGAHIPIRDTIRVPSLKRRP